MVCVRPHARHRSQTSVSLLQKIGVGSPDWRVATSSNHLRRLLWMYRAGHACVEGNERAERLAGIATITSGLRLGRSEVRSSLSYYFGGHAESQGNRAIYRLEERGLERGSFRRSPLKGSSSVRFSQLVGAFSSVNHKRLHQG